MTDDLQCWVCVVIFAIAAAKIAYTAVLSIVDMETVAVHYYKLTRTSSEAIKCVRVRRHDEVPPAVISQNHDNPYKVVYLT